MQFYDLIVLNGVKAKKMSWGKKCCDFNLHTEGQCYVSYSYILQPNDYFFVPKPTQPFLCRILTYQQLECKSVQ